MKSRPVHRFIPDDRLDEKAFPSVPYFSSSETFPPVSLGDFGFFRSVGVSPRGVEADITPSNLDKLHQSPSNPS